MLPHACAFSFLGVQIITLMIQKYLQWYNFSNIIRICISRIILRNTMVYEMLSRICMYHIVLLEMIHCRYERKIESAVLLFILSFFSSVHTIMISQSVKFQLCGRCFRVRRCCILPQFLKIFILTQFFVPIVIMTMCFC